MFAAWRLTLVTCKAGEKRSNRHACRSKVVIARIVPVHGDEASWLRGFVASWLRSMKLNYRTSTVVVIAEVKVSSNI